MANDNNQAERAFEAVVIGRKNWLFAGADGGGETLAEAMSIIERAKLSGHDREACLADILARIDVHHVELGAARFGGRGRRLSCGSYRSVTLISGSIQIVGEPRRCNRVTKKCRRVSDQAGLCRTTYLDHTRQKPLVEFDHAVRAHGEVNGAVVREHVGLFQERVASSLVL